VEADAQEDDIDEHVHNNSHQSHNHNHLNPDSSDAEDDCASIENDENLHHQLTSALKQATMLKRRKLEQGNMTKKVFNIKNNLHRNINNSSGIGNVSDMQHSQMEGRYGGGQAYKEAVSVGNGKSNGQKRFKIKNENLANRSLNNSGGESKIMNNNNLAIYDENSNNSSKLFCLEIIYLNKIGLVNKFVYFNNRVQRQFYFSITVGIALSLTHA